MADRLDELVAEATNAVASVPAATYYAIRFFLLRRLGMIRPDPNLLPLAAQTAMDSASPDWLLIAAALEGEEQAFALLVDRYQAALHKAAVSRLGRRELAEEAVQETFLCAHRWLATYDSQYSFRTWLWTILLNQCSRQAKREGRAGAKRSEVGSQLSEDRGSAAGTDSPLYLLLVKETSEQVHELLARLPDVQADALRLRFFGELTFPEIAAAMEISEPGAKHRVKSGLLKLAEWLGGGRTVRVAEEGAKS